MLPSALQLQQQQQQQQQQHRLAVQGHAADAAPSASIGSDGGCTELSAAAAAAQLDCAGSAAAGAAGLQQQCRQALALIDLAVASVLDAARQQQQQQGRCSAVVLGATAWLESATLLLQLHKVRLQGMDMHVLLCM
jgi:N-acetylglucosamine kinase-like BadF-type ATPase